MDFSNVSRHMGTKLQILLPRLACSHSTLVDGIHSIDLSIAENALIGEEVLVMAKEAVAKSLTLKVIDPNDTYYSMLIIELGPILSSRVWRRSRSSHSSSGILQHLF